MPIIKNDRRATSDTQQLVKAIINVQDVATHVQPAVRAMTAQSVPDAALLGVANVFTLGQTVTITDAGTTNQAIAIVLNHASSGTPAAGFGVTEVIQAHTSTNTMRALYALAVTWATATDASRKGRVQLFAYDLSAREIMRGEATGTAPAIGVLGAAASPRQIGGIATAGAAYSATEQTMLQKVYDALRLFGFLT